MSRTVLAGRVYRPGEGWSTGWLAHDGTTVLETGEGAPPEPPHRAGDIIPAPLNSHTHVGDLVARGHDIRGMTLAEVVAPPDGLKHRVLRETPADALAAAMAEAAHELAAAGARGFYDFREGGAEGARMLRRAAPGAVILGRCQGAWREDEAEAVLAVADGFGLSAMKDVEADVPERMAALARRRGKRFALHLSEDAREDVGRALDLRPDFVVHCVKATRDDVRAIADARVPIVLCPRSNARWGELPDVAAMLAEGARLAIGSDNAMSQSLDVIEDCAFLAQRSPAIAPETWLDAAILGVEEPRRSWLQKGDPAELLIHPGIAWAKG